VAGVISVVVIGVAAAALLSRFSVTGSSGVRPPPVVPADPPPESSEPPEPMADVLAPWTGVGAVALVGFALCALLFGASFVGSGLWVPDGSTELASSVGWGNVTLAVASFLGASIRAGSGRVLPWPPVGVVLLGVGMFVGCIALAAASAGDVDGVPDEDGGRYYFSEDGDRQEVDRELYEEQVVRIRRGDYALAAASTVPGIALGLWAGGGVRSSSGGARRRGPSGGPAPTR
jgi:hypothetical protein